MGKGQKDANAQKRKQLDSVDNQATDHCEETVRSILKDVQWSCDRDAQSLRLNFEFFKDIQHLPYMEMLDAIAGKFDVGKRQNKLPPQAASALRGSPRRMPAPKTCEPRTLRARAGRRHLAPAPTPAVAALTDVGYNVTNVRNLQLEVDLPDGSKRILTHEDFATMNPDDLRGTALERLLTAQLGLQHVR